MNFPEVLLHAFGKELTCPVCLSLFKGQTTRLACSHYFCKSCLDTSLASKSACPLCNTPANRRTVLGDKKIELIVELYSALEAQTGHQLFCTQLPTRPPELSRIKASGTTERRSLSTQNQAGLSDVAGTCEGLRSPAIPVSCRATCSTGESDEQATWIDLDDRSAFIVPVEIEQDVTACEAPSAAPQEAPKGAGRRIPLRLQPWSCNACTFLNQGTASCCKMCNGSRVTQAVPGTCPCPPVCTSSESHEAAVPSLSSPNQVHLALSNACPCNASQMLLGPKPSPGGVPPPPSSPVHSDQQGSLVTPSAMPHSSSRVPACQSPGRVPKECSAEVHILPAHVAGSNRPVHAADIGGVVEPEVAAAAADRPGTKKRRRLDSDLPRAGAKRGPASARNRLTGASPWPSGRAAFVFLGSGLDKSQAQHLKDLQAASGARLLTSWDPQVTHIVCGLDRHGATKRTVKYLMGIVTGRWIVSTAWVDACLRAMAPQPEADFEVLKDSAGFSSGPILGRLRVAEGSQLLHGYEVYLFGSLATNTSMTTLLKSTGARQLKRPPPPDPQRVQSLAFARTVEAKPSAIMLYDADDALPEGVPRAPGILQLSHKWLLDSVSCFEAQPFADYLLA